MNRQKEPFPVFHQIENSSVGKLPNLAKNRIEMDVLCFCKEPFFFIRYETLKRLSQVAAYRCDGFRTLGSRSQRTRISVKNCYPNPHLHPHTTIHK